MMIELEDERLKLPQHFTGKRGVWKIVIQEVRDPRVYTFSVSREGDNPVDSRVPKATGVAPTFELAHQLASAFVEVYCGPPMAEPSATGPASVIQTLDNAHL